MYEYKTNLKNMKGFATAATTTTTTTTKIVENKYMIPN